MEIEQNRADRNTKSSRKKIIAIALIPLLVLGGMIIFLFGPGQSFLNKGISLPEITIERTEFQEDKIIAYIRNTGPEQIEIAQADINDRITPAAIEPGKTLSRLAEAKVIIPFSWTPGVPYEVGVTTSEGTRFSKSIDAAALAPVPNVAQASYFAVIGVYVGVIPVSDRSSLVSIHKKTEYKQIQFLPQSYCRIAGIFGNRCASRKQRNYHRKYCRSFQRSGVDCHDNNSFVLSVVIYI